MHKALTLFLLLLLSGEGHFFAPLMALPTAYLQEEEEAETDRPPQPANSDAAIEVLPGTLSATPVNIKGTLSLLLTMNDEQGEVLRESSGSYALGLNGEKTEIDFSQGYASFPLGNASIESMRIDYLNPEGAQILQFGFHTQGSKTRMREVQPWTSILPPLIAIALALLFREVIGALLGGVIFGTFLLSGFHPQHWLSGIGASFDFFILGAIADSDHASIVLFSMLIGAMVAIISRNGGMYGVVNKLSGLASTPRRAQLVTWFLGLAIFFDDYANTLVVGNTMRPVTDRFRISREKLAYIVDSTAAPVAAIAFITTWIGAELDYIDGAISQLGLNESAYGVFLQSLAYAFYPILTLIFVFMLIMSRRDFGSMFKAERRASSTGALSASVSGREHKLNADLEPEPGTRARWYNAFLPVATVILVTLYGLWTTGLMNLSLEGHDYALFWHNEGFSKRMQLLFSSDLLSKVVGGANSYVALIWASASGVLVAGVLSVGTRSLSLVQVVEAAQSGFKTMLPAIVILILAWSLAAITQQLHTAGFLAAALNESLNPMWLPTLTFVLSALIAFSTGSSWSTMAILYPLVLPLAYNMGMIQGMELEQIMPLFYNVTAMVLAGAVLGDHCSPISDTTILSSLATNCHHVDHVRTQLPYALSVGAVSILCGGVLAVMGLPFYINFPIGIVLLYLIIRYAGKISRSDPEAGTKLAEPGTRLAEPGETVD